MSQTQILLIVAALVVIAVFFWRSKREAKKILNKEKFDRPSTDVLMEGGLKKDPHFDEIRAAMQAAVPSEQPPVYDLLEQENAERMAAEEDSSPTDLVGYEKPPVDTGVQWVLELVPQEGRVFSIGGMQSLWLELKQLNLPLQVNMWVKSRRDQLYYSAKHLPIESTHIVVAVVKANRVALLEPVSASKVLQVLEQAAAHNDVEVRPSEDVEKVPVSADMTRQFISFFDAAVDLLIVPMDPNQGSFSSAQVGSVAKEAGFRPAGSLWEYRLDAQSREPVMTLKLSDDMKSVKLTLDVPLTNFGRDDLKRFFSLANHLANHLGGVWLDAKRNPVDAYGAVMLQKHLEGRMKDMHKHGVDAGSERAARIFARGA